MRTRQTLINEFFVLQKQQKFQSEALDSKVELFMQPILERHSECSNLCLDFRRQYPNLEWIQIQIQPLHLPSIQEASEWVFFKVNLRKQNKADINKKKIRKYTHNFQRKNGLTMVQRKQIQNYQALGYKNQIICGIMQITIHQVRMNKRLNDKKKIKQEIIINKTQQEWLLEQASEQSNSSLFNSRAFHKNFQRRFPEQILSLNQFRQYLKQLNIKYLVPQIKPLQYFVKPERNQQVQEYITKIVMFKKANFNLIFIDECSLGTISKQSHKQWHLKGTFKQQIHRTQPYICMMAGIGEKNFFRYQVIRGTGKAIIFHMFIMEIIKAAQKHYDREKFVLIFDNAAIHTAQSVRELLAKVPHVYTPPYRPEFNGIEHLFSWMKRKLVQNQPMINLQFGYSIHCALNQITASNINSWCESIYNPMIPEIEYLRQFQSE